jgi:hypothetical protein
MQSTDGVQPRRGLIPALPKPVSLLFSAKTKGHIDRDAVANADSAERVGVRQQRKPRRERGECSPGKAIRLAAFGVPAYRFGLAEAAGTAIFVPAMATLGDARNARDEQSPN